MYFHGPVIILDMPIETNIRVDDVDIGGEEQKEICPMSLFEY